MDELEIGGKKYISSKRAAREHRYHIDYVGQLIRGGKIVGKKIGRSWYVEDLSLKNYLRMESGLDPITENEEVEVITSADTTSDEVTPSEAGTESEDSDSMAEITMENIVISEVNDNKVYTENDSLVSEKIETKDVVEQVAEVKREFTVKPIVLGKVFAISETAKKSLNYVRDTEPLIPTLDRKVRENADFMPINLRKPLPAVAVVEEKAPEEIPQEAVNEEVFAEEPVSRPKKRGKALKFAAVTLALIFIVAGAVASSLLSTKINVGDSGTANVRLSLP